MLDKRKYIFNEYINHPFELIASIAQLLKDQGVISDDEYITRRTKLLSSLSSADEAGIQSSLIETNLHFDF